MMKDRIETGSNNTNDPNVIMEAVISFLAIFMPITLVKRVLSLVLIAAGIDNKNINRLTGYGESTIRKLKRDMRTKSLSEILTIRGGGRKAKSAGVEDEIINELEKGDYHTRQQIADMIKEKFNITLSVTAVSRLLKKTDTKD